MGGAGASSMTGRRFAVSQEVGRSSATAGSGSAPAGERRRKPVVQLERTGCGIASVAALAGVRYSEAKAAANALGIFAEDERLWSETLHVRRLLRHFGIEAESETRPFRSWDALPDVALLAIKWHRQGPRTFWHWVVFVREGGRPLVLDSKKSLRRHRRADFGRMKPKWFIPIRDIEEIADRV